MTREDVFDKVRKVLVDALGVDDEDVTPQATLNADLGAESIDYLDIAFRLEKIFGIKIEQAELTQDEVLNDPEYVQDGKVTDRGMDVLRQRLPHADLDAFDQSRNVSDFMNIFTVDVLVKFVQSKVG